MKRKNDTEALERQVKGHPRGYLAEFLVIRAWVAECLRRGHRVRAVFAFLRQERAISFSLHTFRRYVVRYIPEAERVPEMARGSVMACSISSMVMGPTISERARSSSLNSG